MTSTTAEGACGGRRYRMLLTAREVSASQGCRSPVPTVCQTIITNMCNYNEYRIDGTGSCLPTTPLMMTIVHWSSFVDCVQTPQRIKMIFPVWANLDSTTVTYNDCMIELERGPPAKHSSIRPPVHPNRGKLPPVKLYMTISSRHIGTFNDLISAQ